MYKILSILKSLLSNFLPPRWFVHCIFFELILYRPLNIATTGESGLLYLRKSRNISEILSEGLTKRWQTVSMHLQMSNKFWIETNSNLISYWLFRAKAGGGLGIYKYIFQETSERRSQCVAETKHQPFPREGKELNREDDKSCLLYDPVSFSPKHCGELVCLPRIQNGKF